MNDIRKKANQNFQEKQAAKKERYENLSDKNDKLSNDLYNSAKERADHIPFGQPILIGHHSEKADRKNRARIENTFKKSFEASDKSKYYEEKSKSVGTGGILSDDPEAITKLKEKIY